MWQGKQSKQVAYVCRIGVTEFHLWVVIVTTRCDVISHRSMLVTRARYLGRLEEVTRWRLFN